MLRNKSSIVNEDLSEKDLFLLIQKGDKNAFRIIYERYNQLLYVLAYRYLKDKLMAEDAVQHVFVKLWEFHSNLKVSISLKNYLYSMTKNYVLNQIRNKNNAIQHNYKMFQSEDIKIYEDNLIEAIENKEKLEHFFKAIDKLPEQKKQICLLKLEGRLSNQEIACKMNISINTVKAHYAQSIKLLKQYLSKILMLVVIILFV